MNEVIVGWVPPQVGTTHLF